LLELEDDNNFLPIGGNQRVRLLKELSHHFSSPLGRGQGLPGDETSLTNLFCQIFSSSAEELALTRLARCELSRLRFHGHSLLLSSYLCKIKWKENKSCSVWGQQLQDLTHFLLDAPNLKRVRRAIFGSTPSIFDLWTRSWMEAQQLRRCEVPPRHPLSNEVGVAPTTIFFRFQE